MNDQDSASQATAPKRPRKATHRASPDVPTKAGTSKTEAPLTAQRLLELYDRVADAPDAVEQLRTFVLQLAVRGKLVEQSDKEKPHYDLLKLIPEPDTEAFDSTLASWRFPKIGEVLQFCYGKGLKKSERLEQGPVPVYGSNGIVGFTTEPLTDSPAIIVGRKGSAGALNLCNGPSWTTDVAYFVPVPPFFESRYLFLSLQTLDLEKLAKGVKPGLSRADAYDLRLPIPPRAEQSRIVDRVNDLMALLDRLGTTRTQREATRNRFTTASLTRLTAPETSEADFPTHARFVLDNLDHLTSRPEQIKDLYQSIINLAVGGKLVEQDSADESVRMPAADFSIARKDLPSSWLYVSLSQLLSENTRNGYSRRPDDPEKGVPILRISAGTARQDGIVAEEEHKLISDVGDATRRKYALQRGDLLACRFNGNKAYVGRFSIFNDYLGLDPIYPDKLIRIRLNRHFALPEFIRLASESNLIRAQIEQFCTTTVGNWGISASNLKSVQLPLPPLAEQFRIVAEVHAINALLSQLVTAYINRDRILIRFLGRLLNNPLGTRIGYMR